VGHRQYSKPLYWLAMIEISEEYKKIFVVTKQVFRWQIFSSIHALSIPVTGIHDYYHVCADVIYLHSANLSVCFRVFRGALGTKCLLWTGVGGMILPYAIRFCNLSFSSSLSTGK
jgi:hypothetical protein